MKSLHWLIVMLLAVTLLAAPSIALAGYSSDITQSGLAIENGHSSSYIAANAFDNNSATFWASSEMGSAVNGAAWVGQDFGATTQHIQRITIQQDSATRYDVTSIKIQSSNNCSTWVDIGTFAVAQNSTIQQFDIAASSAARCWRALANSGVQNNSNWHIYELEMMTYTEDATPTATSTPIETPTPTTPPATPSAPSATPAHIFAATLSSGTGFQIERSASWGDLSIFGMMTVIAVTLILDLFIRLMNGKRG